MIVVDLVNYKLKNDDTLHKGQLIMVEDGKYQLLDYDGCNAVKQDELELCVTTDYSTNPNMLIYP